MILDLEVRSLLLKVLPTWTRSSLNRVDKRNCHRTFHVEKIVNITVWASKKHCLPSFEVLKGTQISVKLRHVRYAELGAGQFAIAKEITDASRTWGFLLLKNHPIPTKDIGEMFKLSRDFFNDVPEDQKTRWPINGQYVGYSGPLSDRKKDDKASMWFSGKPGCLACKEGQEALPPYWRDKVDRIEAFKHICHDLVIKLLVCLALALDLPDRNYFAKAHAEDGGNGNQFRILCYPARSREPSESTTRMSAHSDSGSVTLLFQTCAGLEIEAPDGKGWVSAPHLENNILVNLGDALAFWSGGQLKATKHRVTFDGVPHDVGRMSMAYFGAAVPDTRLEPLKICGTGEAMEQYKANGLIIPTGITVGEYSKMIMAGIYGSSVEQQPPVANTPT